MDIDKIVANVVMAQEDNQEVVKRIEASKPKLEAAIHSAFGHKPKFGSPKLERSKYLYFTEDGLENDIGLMGLTIGKLSLEVTIEVDHTVKDGSYWGTIDLRWKHKDGGSNGSSLGNIWYHPEDDKWVVRTR